MLRLLVYLIENRNRLVRKQELLDKVWPDAMVTENALTRTIVLLRKALNETAGAAVSGDDPHGGVPVYCRRKCCGRGGGGSGRWIGCGGRGGRRMPAAVAVKRFSRERIWQVAAGVAVVLLISAGVWITMHLRGEPARPLWCSSRWPTG